MPWLRILCVATSALVTGVCLQLCSGVLARQRRALCSPAELSELRRLIARAPERSSDGAPSSNVSPDEAEVGSSAPDVTPDEEEVATAPRERTEQRVVREALAARSRALAVLSLNELTAEVGRALEDARGLPVALGRVALLAGTALALVVTASGLGQGHAVRAAVGGGVCLALAVVGAVGCSVLGRSARQVAERRRDMARELVRAMSTRLPP